MAEFFPLGHTAAIETARRRTLRVGARLEQQIVAAKPLAPLHQLSHSWSPSMAPCEVHPQLSDAIVRGYVGLRK